MAILTFVAPGGLHRVLALLRAAMMRPCDVNALRGLVKGFVVVLLVCLPALACAQEPARLPEGLTSEAPAQLTRGLFAFARETCARSDAIPKLEAACRLAGRGGITLIGDPKWSSEIHYFLYRSPQGTVLITRRLAPRIDEAGCSASIEEIRKVERWPVAKRGPKWPAPFDGRPQRCTSSRFESCEQREVAGVTARCTSQGDDFVASGQCLSIERGASRGMRLLSYFETDDLQGSQFEVREVRQDVPIDSAVFDPEVLARYAIPSR